MARSGAGTGTGAGYSGGKGYMASAYPVGKGGSTCQYAGRGGRGSYGVGVPAVYGGLPPGQGNGGIGYLGVGGTSPFGAAPVLTLPQAYLSPSAHGSQGQYGGGGNIMVSGNGAPASSDYLVMKLGILMASRELRHGGEPNIYRSAGNGSLVPTGSSSQMSNALRSLDQLLSSLNGPGAGGGKNMATFMCPMCGHLEQRQQQ